jgi:hypothetical protein
VGGSHNLNPTVDSKHKEGMFASGYGKDWIKTCKNKTNINSRKEMSRTPKEPAPVITKKANSFEILCNLNDGTSGKREGRHIQLDTNNSEKKNHRTSVTKLTNMIPVIITGGTSVECNKYTGHKFRNDTKQK